MICDGFLLRFGQIWLNPAAYFVQVMNLDWKRMHFLMNFTLWLHLIGSCCFCHPIKIRNFFLHFSPKCKFSKCRKKFWAGRWGDSYFRYCKYPKNGRKKIILSLNINFTHFLLAQILCWNTIPTRNGDAEFEAGDSSCLLTVLSVNVWEFLFRKLPSL